MRRAFAKAALALSLRLALGLGLALVTIGLVPDAGAQTQNKFVFLERLEAEPTFGGLVRVSAWVAPIESVGTFIDVPPEKLALELRGARRSEVPGVLRATLVPTELHLVVVVQTSLSWEVALTEGLDEPMRELFKSLPPGTKGAIVPYHTRARSFTARSPSELARVWASKVRAEDDASPSMLLAGLDRGLKALKALKPSKEGAKVRRVMIVLSDGVQGEGPHDDPAVRSQVNKRWKQAREAGVTIFTVGYSLYDQEGRGPMRNLGQLSRKTGGMFRLVYTRNGFKTQIQKLGEQLRMQPVLTWFLPADVLEGSQMKAAIVCKPPGCGSQEIKSEALPLTLGCGETACGEGNVCALGTCAPVLLQPRSSGLGLWLGLGGGLLGVLGILALVLLRNKRGAIVPGRPGALGGVAAAAGAAPAGAPGTMAATSAGAPGALPAVPGVAASVVAATAAASAAAWPAGAVRAYVMIESGPQTGQVLPLRHGFNVGKNPGNDLIIDDGYTSGHHAQFIFDARGGCTVVDLQSTNGTYVNDQRITQMALANGTGLRIGQTSLRFLQG